MFSFTLAAFLPREPRRLTYLQVNISFAFDIVGNFYY